MPPKQSRKDSILPQLAPPSKNILYEIGLDECGRGPLFGRVYAAAVILPRDGTFDFSKMRDSKKIHSKKKMRELADYIKSHAVGWSIQYEETDTIDRINILQADMNAMHKCVHDVVSDPYQSLLLVDGNYFRPFSIFDQTTDTMHTIAHVTVEQGDSKHASIAAASILAKDARDEYILKLCEEYPELKTRYSLERNMGYGTKAHLEGIHEHGITQWHRCTFGPCKNAKKNYL